MRPPRDRRVTLVHSTCSTSEDENEGVVAQALALRPEWKLRSPTLPGWPHRGIATRGLGAEDAAATARFCAERDLCLGFFIACFERRHPDVTGERGEMAVGEAGPEVGQQEGEAPGAAPWSGRKAAKRARRQCSESAKRHRQRTAGME